MKGQTDPYGSVTAGPALRQGDEEINKRIKKKNKYLNKLSNISD